MDRYDVGRSRIPIARTRALNATPNARSLSRMRYFGALSHGNASAIWRASHSAVGLRVTANHSNRRRSCPRTKCEKLLERNGRNHKQINRRNPFHVIADEGLPGLQWPIWPRYHVDRNRRLRELDTELEQLAMDLGGAPDRVLKAHSSDQIPHLFGDPRPAPGRTRLPSPVSGKTPSMPPQDGLWSDDGYGVKDARATTIEPNE